MSETDADPTGVHDAGACAVTANNGTNPSMKQERTIFIDNSCVEGAVEAFIG
jgi:hypothetical protein